MTENLLPSEGLTMELIGEIGAEELPELAGREKPGTQQLQRLRSVHHCAARMLAAGFKETDVAARTGMHPSRVSILKNDPAFQGLMRHYEDQEAEAWADARERAAQVGTLAMEVLQDRLLEDPESVTTKQLLDVMERGLSHGGFPASQRIESDSRSVIQEIKDGVKEKGVVVDGGSQVAEGESASAEPAQVSQEASGDTVREAAGTGAQEALSLADLRALDSVPGEGDR